MKIDVLYFQGCPNHEPTVQRVRRVISRLGVTADVREVELTQEDDPVAMKFIGSPTVMIDGQDIDPAQRAKASYGFGCRTFGGAGVPPVEMIEQALREASDYGGGTHDCCSPRAPAQQAEGKPGQSNRLSFWSTPAALGSAILSSACCWLPLLLLAFGLSAGGVAGFFESARPLFLVVAAIFLGAGFYFAYFRKVACKPGDACAVPNPRLQRFNRVMLWVATVFVIAFALFPYYSPALIRAFAGTPTANLGSSGPLNLATQQTTRIYHIDGMTCSACAAGLEVRLATLPGVSAAHVSFDDSTAAIQSISGKPQDEAVRATVSNQDARSSVQFSCTDRDRHDDDRDIY